MAEGCSSLRVKRGLMTVGPREEAQHRLVRCHVPAPGHGPVPRTARVRRCSADRADTTDPRRRTPQRNGFHIRISFGISVSAPKMATVIATVVRMPKMMLGTKFDSTSIEKPQHTVSVV